MSCPHGNHPDNCDICDEVEAAYKSGVDHTKQSREWECLSNAEVTEVLETVRVLGSGYSMRCARAIEAKLKEKNT